MLCYAVLCYGMFCCALYAMLCCALSVIPLLRVSAGWLVGD